MDDEWRLGARINFEPEAIPEIHVIPERSLEFKSEILDDRVRQHENFDVRSWTRSSGKEVQSKILGEVAGVPNGEPPGYQRLVAMYQACLPGLLSEDGAKNLAITAAACWITGESTPEKFSLLDTIPMQTETLDRGSFVEEHRRKMRRIQTGSGKSGRYELALQGSACLDSEYEDTTWAGHQSPGLRKWRDFHISIGESDQRLHYHYDVEESEYVCITKMLAFLDYANTVVKGKNELEIADPNTVQRYAGQVIQAHGRLIPRIYVSFLR